MSNMWGILLQNKRGENVVGNVIVKVVNCESFWAGFVLRHPLVASAVFGATKIWHVEEVVAAITVELGPEILADINNVHWRLPNPCP